MTAGTIANESLPRRAPLWKLRGRTLTLPRRPLVMGIVNVTPDSFSDGGRYLEPTAAIEHGLRLVEAMVLDRSMENLIANHLPPRIAATIPYR